VVELSHLLVLDGFYFLLRFSVRGPLLRRRPTAVEERLTSVLSEFWSGKVLEGRVAAEGRCQRHEHLRLGPRKQEVLNRTMEVGGMQTW
jgi:hypothetical protein